MGILAGAEMTTFEMRFIALRCKDTIAPTGTIAQGVHAKQLNSKGEVYENSYGLRTSERCYGTVEENRKGNGLIGIKPYSTACGLTHLGTVMLKKKVNGHCTGIILLQLLTDEVGTCQHIGPLVVSTELHVTSISLVELKEIVSLEKHVAHLAFILHLL